MVINYVKTFVLLTLLSGLLILIGTLAGGPAGMVVSLVMALVMNMVAYFFSDAIVLRLYGAQPMDEHKYESVYDSVRALTYQMGMPMPKLWIIPTNMANAFATGRNPSHSSVVITQGIYHSLDARQLRGVLSHELAHIKNRDILIATIAATLATAISYLAHILQYATFFRSDDRRKNSNAFGALVAAIVLPFAAMLIQLAISRSREYKADETGAHYSHDPLALADALEILHHHASQGYHSTTAETVPTTSTASLFIVNPFSAQGLVALFSTHPPVQNRIQRLRQMYKKML